MASTSHRWRFFRAGGVDQVLLETGEDLLALDELDPKLWVALACPVTTIEFDQRSAKLLDVDNDGRIRVSDIVDAVRWLRPRLKKPADLIGGRSELQLSSINEATPEGEQLLEAARRALLSLGKRESPTISVNEVEEALVAFGKMPLNGDGVVTVASTDDAELKAAITDLVAASGGVKDRSGEPGVDRTTLDAFFADAEAYLAWAKEADQQPDAHPLGERTREGWEQFVALAPKLDDYFARTRLAAFDPRATSALNRDEKEFALMAPGSFSADVRELASFPIARIEADRPLPLTSGINPAWANSVTRFREVVLTPLLGAAKNELRTDDWQLVRARFAAYEGWLGQRKPGLADKLPRARVETLVNSGVRGRIEELIREDAALAPTDAALVSLARLLYLVRDLHRFANNFVNFRDFYSRRGLATFQSGTLYLDQRSCELCLQVEPGGAHATMSALSRAYLAYCDCVRKGSGEKMSIVAAFTAGESDNLMVGRNGIFYDRRGREWDATITRIVDNPVSIRQAFWSPYKKLIRFVEEQVARRAADKETAANERLAAGASEVVHADATKLTPAKKAGIDVGVVAALGVAVGGITAAFGALLQAFFGLGFWMPLGAVALLFAISGPSMLIAYLKLRQRNLGPLLDANGWAVNTRAKINVPFGGALTRVAALPPGATRDLADPFPEKKQPWKTYLAVVVLLIAGVLWGLGRLDPWMPDPLQAGKVFGWKDEPPPPPPPAPVPAP